MQQMLVASMLGLSSARMSHNAIALQLSHVHLQRIWSVFLAAMLDCAIVGMSWLVPISIFSLNKCEFRPQLS